MIRYRWAHIGVFSVVLSSLFGSTASAYLVMASLNTYKGSHVVNAVQRVDDLHGDGVWFITVNSDFDDRQFRSIFARLGGRQVSEDNPTANNSYSTYVRVTGEKPDQCFCYNETGGSDGGTLLTDSQIDQQFASHGNQSLVCLTRAYVGNWKTQVDRCLSNPKVGGICMEYVKGPLLDTPPGQHNGAPWNVKAILAAGKKCYILMHAGADGWSDSQNRKIIQNLNRWVPAEMATDDVILVYQNYDKQQAPADTTEEWLGATESVASAIRQAKAMPNYTGKQISFSFGRHGHLDGWLPSASVREQTITHEGEYLLLAAKASDPYLSRTGLSVNGSKTNRIRVMVKAEHAGHMQLFWGIKGDDVYRASRSKTVTYRVANQWQELQFDMSDDSDWVGQTIARLRFDTTRSSDKETYTWIDYIIED